MSKFVDALIGFAVGDAMGVPTEFCSRKELFDNPVQEMICSSKVGQPAGTWSDDTSMTICTIDSLIRNKEFNYSDIMNNFILWINENKFTANNDTFDVGRTCLNAISNFNNGISPLECGIDGELNNGNGSLMRMLPVALYCYYEKLTDEEIIKLVNDVSSLTHRHDISKMGCYIYVRYFMCLLDGYNKSEAYNLIKKLDYSSYSELVISKYKRVLEEDISLYKVNDINSSGYVVDTLECSLWIFLNSNSYKEAIIASTNIGNDTDTIGAITGSLCGIYYGIDSIPNNWLDKLLRKDYLIELSLNYEDILVKKIKNPVIGAIIGDIVGSRFEFHNNKNGKAFDFFHEDCTFTDDSVMTLGVLLGLMNSNKDYSDVEDKCTKSMIEVGRRYPNCGYGGSFYRWIMTDNHEPYGSYANGAAMRISGVGTLIKDIDKIKEVSNKITSLTHNHSDSIIGAEIVSIVIRLCLDGFDKEYIRNYIENNYFKIEDITDKKFHINCLETVREVLCSFFDSYDYEDSIRIAISHGGDTDTIGAITGSMSAAYYGIPEDIYNEGYKYLDDYLRKIYDNFNLIFNK